MGKGAGQLTDNDLGSLARGVAGPGSSTAGRCENTHRPNVFEPAPQAGYRGMLPPRRCPD
ncbi:hypothetical protein MBOT_40000 [Mycobacterium botniense]|uniref:Uncharacterized protein n=1 Tax=Mycobacterium botniense TaxID=84962 RepID=A0A7I9Y3J5_9MYCO|nr:hypothetical protein MBOT_40000 [Mycobacterium botniense]